MVAPDRGPQGHSPGTVHFRFVGYSERPDAVIAELTSKVVRPVAFNGEDPTDEVEGGLKYFGTGLIHQIQIAIKTRAQEKASSRHFFALADFVTAYDPQRVL